MISRISTTIDSNSKVGYQNAPLDKAIGSETNYLNGVSAGAYSVPANTKLTMKMMSLSVRNGLVGVASRSTELSSIINVGVWTSFIDSTQLNESRLQWMCLPAIPGADEMVVQGYNAFQSPGLGEGITIPAGSTFTVKCTPAQNTNIVWYVIAFGKNTDNTVNIQKTINLTATTTSSQTLLSYTPDSDWILTALDISVDVPAQVLGQAVIKLDGRQVIETPYLGLGESSSNMFDDKGYCGYGHGSLNIPLWGIELYPGENIDFVPLPLAADQSIWGLTLVGTETTLTSTTGATCFAF